jgi:hypothetical protein
MFGNIDGAGGGAATRGGARFESDYRDVISPRHGRACRGHPRETRSKCDNVSRTCRLVPCCRPCRSAVFAAAAKTPGQRGQVCRALIADAIIRTESFRIGAYALIVDAEDERASAFYAANGFASIPDEARRMFLPMATALQLLEGERRG